ncbi:prepilin-type N-terminal cleavage/methylation domain-containing protein [Marinicella meishanensis]|uniref:prepilin-type N-terminal cleavage/methylation domain-containing protein n=1 Tax=Marinicella meishanensis TaxID=2873263 RepID=UPI001CC011DA|nr:prepilin-type N-terminal cleavage/methylation domain-containing protein [Marinicella sp. NBU2979]
MFIRGLSTHSVPRSAGFTLLEILLVVLIIGILASAGANLLASQSIERQIMGQAQTFEAELKYLCERAVLENQAFGVEWQAEGYQLLRHQHPEWIPVTAEPPAWPTGVTAEILTAGRVQALAPDFEDLPHIVCQTDGSFNAFELRLAANPDQHYAIRSQSPWELAGGWHQP